MKRYAWDAEQGLIEHKSGAFVMLSDVEMQKKAPPHITGEYVSLDDINRLLGEEGRQLIEDGERFRFLLSITSAADGGDTLAEELLRENLAVQGLIDRRHLIDTMRHQAAAAGWLAA